MLDATLSPHPLNSIGGKSLTDGTIYALARALETNTGLEALG